MEGTLNSLLLTVKKNPYMNQRRRYKTPVPEVTGLSSIGLHSLICARSANCKSNARKAQRCHGSGKAKQEESNHRDG
jgi:hypothetical protein